MTNSMTKANISNVTIWDTRSTFNAELFWSCQPFIQFFVSYGSLISSFSCFQLPGVISLATKFVPTIMNLMKRLAEEGNNPAANNPQRHTSRNNTNAVPVGSSVSSSSSSNITALENGNRYTSSSKDE